MPRIIVMTDVQRGDVGQPILLDEHVQSVHLSTDHAASQLVERLAWAVLDAESSEASSKSERALRVDRRPTRRRAAALSA